MALGKTLFSWCLYREYKGNVTVPTRRSATVRFIMRYVLRLRRWRILAKAMMVITLIIVITRDSVTKTGNQTGESPIVISLALNQRF